MREKCEMRGKEEVVDVGKSEMKSEGYGGQAVLAAEALALLLHVWKWHRRKGK